MEHPIHTLADGAASPALTSRLDAGIAAWAQLVDAVREAALHAQVVTASPAAIASHVAAEFLGKCVHDRAPLPAINLAESLSSVTAIGNDYGYGQVFVRGVRGLGRAGDVYVAMSTSGRSPNVVASLAAARELGITTIAEARRFDLVDATTLPSNEPSATDLRLRLRPTKEI